MINDIKKSWKLIWEHYIAKPNMRVGERGWALISGYMVFVERVK